MMFAQTQFHTMDLFFVVSPCRAWVLSFFVSVWQVTSLRCLRGTRVAGLALPCRSAATTLAGQITI